MKKLICLFLLFAIWMTGCGRAGAGKPDDGNADVIQQATGTEDSGPVLAYVPETLDLGIDEFLTSEVAFWDTMSVNLTGDDFYFIIYGEESKLQFRFCRYSLAEKTMEPLTPLIPETSEIELPNKFDIGEDGSIYGASARRWLNADGTSRDSMHLTKYNAAGDVIYNRELTEIMNASSLESEDFSPIGVFADRSGKVWLVGGKEIFFFDEEGNLLDRLDPLEGRRKARIDGAGRGEDGMIYIHTVAGEGGFSDFQDTLLELDTRNRSFKTLSENFPHNGAVNAGLKKTFLQNNYRDSTLYDYDPVTQSAEPLLCWNDYGYSDMLITYVAVTPDEKILVVANDRSTGSLRNATVRLFSMTMTQKKEEILLGTVMPSTVLENAVIKFNRSSDRYRITIKNYLNGQTWSAQAAEEAWARLVMELAAGNGPDIIEMGSGEIAALAKQGFLEDLNPYLDQSEVIGREDFVEHVLEGALYQEKLAVLPKQFQIFTVVGNASEVGTDMGWTREELIALAERHPKAQVLNYPGKGNLLRVVMGYDIGAFVDREAGRCSFDSPEFVRLLEFADRYGGNTAPEEEYTPALYQREDILLSEITLMDYRWTQMQDTNYEGQANAVGYPTADGSASHYIVLDQSCGISSVSRHKEGAWAFLEALVNTPDTTGIYAFPALKTRLEEQVREETGNVEYLYDEEGAKILDENGNPAIKQKLVSSEMLGNLRFDYRTATEEEAERTLEIIRSARLLPSEDQEIRAIIDEEAAGYFGGSRTAQQVAAVIQNRVQLYLNER